MTASPQGNWVRGDMEPRADQPRIAVVGSANVDVIMRVERAPGGGETVTGGQVSLSPGGKGANQAVALARLGARVELAARLGQDPFAEVVLRSLRAAGIAAGLLAADPLHPTGTAVILVDARGDNRIAVDYGANLFLCREDAQGILDTIREFDLVLLQCEVGEALNLEVARVARASGVPVVLNPASVLPRSLELLTGVHLITPNLVEARALAGLYGTAVSPDGHPFDQAALAARALLDAGVQRIVVTLGKHGALYLSKEERLELGVYPTTQVDATGAGDAFTAAMAYGLARGLEAEVCVRLAGAVAALAVARLGAQPSFPTMAEVRRFMAGTAMAPARA